MTGNGGTPLSVRRAKAGRIGRPRWLTAAMLALAVLASAPAVVSFSAHYQKVHAGKGTVAVAALEAAIPDVAAPIFATPGIALALHGRRASCRRLSLARCTQHSYCWSSTALRRGEVLGLRWTDIDFDARSICVSQQLQRIRGQLLLGPVKTRAGQRNLPLLALARQALERRPARQARYRADIGTAWPDTHLVFTTRTGRRVEPRNFVRSFRRICDDNDIRLIAVHHVRHTVASLLKALGVPARDAQVVLGHSRLAVTLEIYTHSDDDAKLDALTRLHGLFDQPQK